MSQFFSLLNAVAVSLFGSILSAAFCDALSTPKRRRFFWLIALCLPLVQGLLLLVRDYEFVRLIYPLSVHLPLWLALCALTGKYIAPVAAVLSAYLCCQLRRWMALLIVALCSGGTMLQDISELVLTLPLLWLLLHFTAPVLREITNYSKKEILQFAIIPALYYSFDYLTRIYTDLLIRGVPAAVEFMPFICCMAYLVFITYTSLRRHTHDQLIRLNQSLDIQLAQSVRRIGLLRESQEQSARYRHDLRHHLQYLSSCLENGQTQQAQDYIRALRQDIEAQKAESFCHNEVANLLFSAFTARADKEGTKLCIRAAVSPSLSIPDGDLCVLLSNALENALNACRQLPRDVPPVVDVQCHEKAGQFFLQITNPVHGDVPFRNGIPVAQRSGHGIGVQSIQAIVKRHGGIGSFSVEDGHFILRLCI